MLGTISYTYWQILDPISEFQVACGASNCIAGPIKLAYDVAYIPASLD